jgi:deoxyribonuclease-4
MPRFGSHLSVAGGLFKAPVAAQGYGFDCVQLFTKAPSQWAAKPIPDEDATQFRAAVRGAKMRCTVVHDSYLINLASPDDSLWQKSIEALVDEVLRAEQIGANYLVAHPGATLGSDEDAGLTKVATALDEVHRRSHGFAVQILLENTAGQGTTLGHRFEHLAAILDRVGEPARLGVCFDTCHAFAAGYALAPEGAYQDTMTTFDRLIGVKRLKVFHVNDSKKPLGSRVDRHEHIGRGQLGLEPFRLLVNDRRFRTRPMILETAKEIDPQLGDMDAVNLATLRGLLRNADE